MKSINMFPGYFFDQGIWNRQYEREQKRRRELAQQIVRELSKYHALPYEAIADVERILEARDER